MSEDNVPQVFTKKFDRKNNSGPGKLNGFLDEEPEELDRPRSWVMDLSPGEYKAALFTLYFSLSILISKLIIGNKDTLRSITEKIAQAKRRQEMAHAHWPPLPLPPIVPAWLGDTLFAVESTWRSVRLVLLPLMWSFFFTFYTWFMIYKNIRHVPGVDTPTPLTPTRHQEANVGGSFYLDYCLPLAISFCGFLLMLYLSHL